MGKKRNIVAAALHLFVTFGFKRVTIEEICREGGVSKGTFYKHFKNKGELAGAILRSLMESALSEFELILKNNDSFFLQVEALIAMKIRIREELGDLFINDLYQEIPETIKIMESIKNDNYESSLKLYSSGVAQGVIRADMCKREFLFYIVRISNFYYDKEYIEIVPDNAKRIKHIIEHFFFGVVKKEEV